MSLPVKAPPPAAPPPLDIHGFLEFDFESFLINPSGQALINNFTTTVVTGLDWTLYKSKTGIINKVGVGFFIASDWTQQNNLTGYWAGFIPSQDGSLFDVAGGVNGSVTFGQYWTLTDTFYNVYSGDVAGIGSPVAVAGCAATGCSGFNTLIWNELKLSLNDSFTGWPITFNPYVTWYYEFNSIGPNTLNSAACFACEVNNSEFFVGVVPTLSLQKYVGVPITLKAPTYFTVGPSSFWNANPAVFGASSGDLGMFTTGLTGSLDLTWIPANYGHWYVKAGFQFYDIINNALIGSNIVSLGTASTSATKDIWVGFGGIGVGF